MKKIIGLTFLPLGPDVGLLLLRVTFATLMIVFHGWEKLMTWERQLHTFPDLIGLGSEISYVLVAWVENFGAVAIILGLFTRIHALGLAITMFVAFTQWHDWRFTGSNAGEMAFAYGFAYLLLFLTGAGKYSLDRKLGI
jgi:putative oxidoreductase